MTKTLGEAMDVLQESHEDGDVSLDTPVIFRTPDGRDYTLGQFETPETDSGEPLIVDLISVT